MRRNYIVQQSDTPRFLKSLSQREGPNGSGRIILTLVTSHLAENRKGYADSEGRTDETIERKAKAETSERRKKKTEERRNEPLQDRIFLGLSLRRRLIHIA